MRIFDDPQPTEQTPAFYQIQDEQPKTEFPKQAQETKKMHPLLDTRNFKKKKETEPIQPVENEKRPEPENNEENVGFLDRIRNYFKPKPSQPIRNKPEESYDDGDFADEYMRSINKKKLNYDYNQEFDQQIPPNVNN